MMYAENCCIGITSDYLFSLPECVLRNFYANFILLHYVTTFKVA